MQEGPDYIPLKEVLAVIAEVDDELLVQAQGAAGGIYAGRVEAGLGLLGGLVLIFVRGRMWGSRAVYDGEEVVVA